MASSKRIGSSRLSLTLVRGPSAPHPAFCVPRWPVGRSNRKPPRPTGGGSAQGDASAEPFDRAGRRSIGAGPATSRSTVDGLLESRPDRDCRMCASRKPPVCPAVPLWAPVGPCGEAIGLNRPESDGSIGWPRRTGVRCGLRHAPGTAALSRSALISTQGITVNLVVAVDRAVPYSRSCRAPLTESLRRSSTCPSTSAGFRCCIRRAAPRLAPERSRAGTPPVTRPAR